MNGFVAGIRRWVGLGLYVCVCVTQAVQCFTASCFCGCRFENIEGKGCAVVVLSLGCVVLALYIWLKLTEVVRAFLMVVD